MNIIFTICSNNYLAQASVLFHSVRQHEPNWTFVVGLIDRRSEEIDYSKFEFDLLDVAIVEPAIDELSKKFSIVELNTCVKPRYFQYFMTDLEKTQVIYLDPDTRLYAAMTEVNDALVNNEFVLTPHILSPIPLDGKTPDESLFLNYGLYNLGFLALKRTAQTLAFLEWWRQRTYESGYDRPSKGLFTDQLWINLVPLYFKKVEILRHRGYNMAPWNFHERYLKQDGKGLQLQQNQPLVLFHFSGFVPGQHKFHKDYTRHEMDSRPDLVPVYKDYASALETAGDSYYKSITCYYVAVRQRHLLERHQLEEESIAKARLADPLYKKLIRRVKHSLPDRTKRTLLNMIKI
jgi:hypothetical protein